MRYLSVFALLFYIQTFQCLSYRPNPRLNFFDTDLLRSSCENRPGNVIISPASVKATLALLLEGSNGASADEIRRALRLAPDKVEYREQLNMYLNSLKSNSSSVVIENANAAFITDRLKVKKGLEQTLRNLYLTQVFKVDFLDPVSTALSVNNWVNASTRGYIPAIVDPALIDPNSNILFSNALFFKGTWKYAFDPQQTHGACFHVRSGCRMVQMMQLQAELKYAFVDELRAHAVELPYEGGRFSMLVLIPLERDGWSSVVRDMPYMSLPQILRLMEPNDLELSLPKFVVDFSGDMSEPLTKMGIKTVFTPAANLSQIFEGSNCEITSIYHKVHISVDETGTIAAAASSAIIVPLIHNSVSLKADKPFLIFIIDNGTGQTLFEGKIEDPIEFIDENVRVSTTKQNAKRPPSLFKRILG